MACRCKTKRVVCSFHTHSKINLISAFIIYLLYYMVVIGKYSLNLLGSNFKFDYHMYDSRSSIQLLGSTSYL